MIRCRRHGELARELMCQRGNDNLVWRGAQHANGFASDRDARRSVLREIAPAQADPCRKVGRLIIEVRRRRDLGDDRLGRARQLGAGARRASP